MKRRVVLFVDDELNILEGLKTRLHRQRQKWDMRFVHSGAEALDLVSREEIDVIVSDMRMPEMDGAALLQSVKQLRPRVIRIVLSGQAEMETALKAISVAHQFLNKPCEPGVLESVIDRACNLQALIHEEAVMRIVGRIDRLPSLPKTYSSLLAALGNEKVRVDDIAGILRQDMAMCAKTLQLVNSAFFRLQRTIGRIEEAVSYLGFSTIRQIALAVEVFQSFKPVRQSQVSLEALQLHAMRVGSLAASMFDEEGAREDAFVAGLLHDIGKLVLATELPDRVDEVLREMAARRCAMHAAEAAVLGATHAEVGAYLLGLWGLPYRTVEAVANHHAPRRVASTAFDLLAATYVANELAAEAWGDGEAAAPKGDGSQGLDLLYLRDLGVSDRLERWRERARRLGSEASLATRPDP